MQNFQKNHSAQRWNLILDPDPGHVAVLGLSELSKMLFCETSSSSSSGDRPTFILKFFMASDPLPMVQEQPGTGLAGMDPAEINMQINMQLYVKKQHKICKYIDCISQICKGQKYA